MPAEDFKNDSLASEGLRSSLRVLLHVSCNWKSLIWKAAALIAMLGSGVALLLPNLYTATVVILPPQQGSSAGAALMAQLGSMGGIASMGAGAMGIKNPNDLQVAFLKSDSVENAMIEHFRLNELYHYKFLSKTRKQWEKLTHVESGLKDGLIRLTVEDRDPRRAAQLANGWVEEYRRFSATLAVTEAAQRRLFFEQQLNSARTELERAEEMLKQTEQRTGVIQMEGQAHAMIESAAVLRGQIAAKQVELRAMREFAAEQNPDLVRAEQELASLEGQLSQMNVNSSGRTGDLVAPKGSMTESGLDYTRALREAKYRETVYGLLARQYEVARIDEAREGSPVQVVDAAAVPDHPSSTYRWWIFAASVLGAFPLSLLIALVAEAITILRRRRAFLISWAGPHSDGLAEGAR